MEGTMIAPAPPHGRGRVWPPQPGCTLSTVQAGKPRSSGIWWLRRSVRGRR